MKEVLRPRVAVFAKAPVPGYAKTRLIPKLGAAGAADLQAGFIRQTLATVCATAAFDTNLWCAPDSHDPFFLACAETFKVQLIEQADGDLGTRMQTAFATLASETTPLVLVGTDCPALTTQHIADAHTALRQGFDAVFIPTEDGGYALIGLRHGHAALFTEMPWSTAAVMAQTRQRLHQQGLRWHELETLWDVDEPADHERWVHRTGKRAP
jgi:rSAM/selenodomain-associated transferase 1